LQYGRSGTGGNHARSSIRADESVLRSQSVVFKIAVFRGASFDIKLIVIIACKGVFDVMPPPVTEAARWEAGRRLALIPVTHAGWLGQLVRE